MRSTTSEPRVTIALIIVCAVVFLATNGFSGGLGEALERLAARTGPQSTSATTTGGWSPRASCTRARSTSSSTCTCCGCWATCWSPTLGSGRFAALYFTALLWGAFGALVASPNVADGRRLGRGLRADGRGRGRAARARHQPVQDRHRRAHRPQPRALVRASAASRSAGTSAAWSAASSSGWPSRAPTARRSAPRPSSATSALRRCCRRRRRSLAATLAVGSRWSADVAAQTSTSSAAPAGSGTRSGCRMWAMSSRPSTRRGPGREK